VAARLTPNIRHPAVAVAARRREAAQQLREQVRHVVLLLLLGLCRLTAVKCWTYIDIEYGENDNTLVVNDIENSSSVLLFVYQ